MSKDLCRIKFDGSQFIATKYENVSPFLEADDIVKLSKNDLKVESKKEFFISPYAVEKYGLNRKKHIDKFVSDLDLILLELYEKHRDSTFKNKDLIFKIYSDLKEKCSILEHRFLSLTVEEKIYTFEDNSIKIIEKIENNNMVYDESMLNKIKEFTYRQITNINRRHRIFYDRALSNSWNYFATFTYDNVIFYEKITHKKWKKNKDRSYNRKWVEGLNWIEENKKDVEDLFKKQLSNKLSNLHSKKGLKYMGVWERGSEKGRLHFHCFIYIPDCSDIGKFREVKEYNSFINEKIEININEDFEKKFGRNDFSKIDDQYDTLFFKELNYMLKYITKQSDKVVYSRGLKDKILVVGDFENNKLLKLNEESSYYVMSPGFMDDIIYIDKNYDVLE